MRRYELVDIQPVTVRNSLDLMSPFVWREGDQYWMALRVIETDGSSQVCFATGDGTDFTLADHPALTPGPQPEDISGCEDPTVFFHDGKCKIYYTGWNAEIRRAKLLFASGPSIQTLTKHGDVLQGVEHWNTKEATIVEGSSGWRLFYEYSDAAHSLIGCAFSDQPDGDWRTAPDPFGLRPDQWDSWHLSTGPTAFDDTDAPVMFYNGSDVFPRWRIGWVEFDRDFTMVTRRCQEPLIHPDHLPDGFTDIAFAASVVSLGGGVLDLYFSVGDRRLMKATIRTSE